MQTAGNRQIGMEGDKESGNMTTGVLKNLDPGYRPRELERQAQLACSDLIGVGAFVEECPHGSAFRLCR
jgi:hypothetical protein